MGVWVRDARAELQSLRGAGSAVDGDVQKVRRLRAEARHFYRRLELLRTLRPQTTVDCVGAKQTVEYSLDVTDDVVALFGVQREDYTYRLGRGRVTLCGYKGHFRESAEYAVDLIEQGKLNLAPLVTHDLPLERYGEGLALLEERKAIKVCYWPWES